MYESWLNNSTILVEKILAEKSKKYFSFGGLFKQNLECKI